MSDKSENGATCDGVCLTGADIGVGGSGVDDISHPHPDCPRHGHLWKPFDNQWSRNYVAAHPERFPTTSPEVVVDDG
jgi:hypothetical protein